MANGDAPREDHCHRADKKGTSPIYAPCGWFGDESSNLQCSTPDEASAPSTLSARPPDTSPTRKRGNPHVGRCTWPGAKDRQRRAECPPRSGLQDALVQ